MENKLNENKLKALKVSQSREKAKEVAELQNFNSITIYNYTMEVNLKGKDVEYEMNFNPRYARYKKEIYNGDTKNNQICNKSNRNIARLMQIVNNANSDFVSDSQYIVFHKELVQEINKWLESLMILDSHLKYGKIKEDIEEFKKIFPDTHKKWLVIDGNSYFSTIHQIYLTEKQTIKEAESDDIKYWARFYAKKSSKGKGYIKDMLSTEPYIRDIQMLQLIALVLDKNTRSWDNEDIKIFSQRLNRLLFAIVYRKNTVQTANNLFVTMQAVKYLVLPSMKPILYNQSKRMDFITLISLFTYEGNLVNIIPLQDTTYNIKLFRGIIEGLITKNANHLNIHYVLDCLNEVYQAMIEYQNMSLELLKNTEGQSARDRLTKIDTLCKPMLRINHSLKDAIINEQLPTQLVRRKLNILVEMMLDTYKDYLNKNVQIMIQRNPNLLKNVESIYKMGNISQQMSMNDFLVVFMDAIKINN